MATRSSRCYRTKVLFHPRSRFLTLTDICESPPPWHRTHAPSLPMNMSARLPSFIALALLAAAPLAPAQDSDLAELKATMRAMQKTIADQNARIATLEKQQQSAAKQKPATTGAPTASSRSVTVGGLNVPVAELPAAAVPA